MSDLLLIKAGYGSLENTLDQQVTNGTFRVTSNEELFVDIDNKRLHLASVVIGNTEEQIKTMAVANILRKIYISSDTLKLFWYDTATSKWVVVGGDHVAIADLATNAINDENGNNIAETYETKTDATAKKSALDREIADLDAAIAKIHSFEIRKVASKEELPMPGSGNIIYLVPSDKEEESEKNVYDEYIWITDEELVPYQGYYESIGTSEAALDNYYTKGQIDAQEAEINATIEANDTASQSRDTALGTRIDNLTTTVGDNKTASENADAALGTRIDELTTTVATNKTDSESRDTALGVRIDTLTQTVTDNKTAADKTQEDLDTLEEDVSTINRFKTWYGLEMPELAIGDPYTIYFVAKVGLPGDNEKYSEYIYVPDKEFTKVTPVEGGDEGETQETTVTIPAHYEKISSTNEFLNYYTKAEVDQIAQALQANITTNVNDIADLRVTVGTNKTASESRDSALDTRLTAVEEAIGSGQGTGSLSDRMAAAEEAIATNKTNSETRDAALSDRATALETAVGTEETEGTILNRIKTTEDNLAAQVAKEAEDYTELDSRIDSNDTDIEGLDTRLSSVEEVLGDGTGEGTITSRMTAAEGRLDTAESNITSLTGRMTTAESDIAAMDTAYKAADTALQSNIDALSDTVDHINRFNIVMVDSFEDLPATGEKFVIYFVPNEGGEGDQRYLEYMWIEGEEEGDGYYEQIDSTSANLDNYYTKTEIDGKVSTINTTVETNKTDSESRDSALDTRVTALETTMGEDAQATGSVLNRLAAAESNIATNKTDSESRDSALDTRLTTVEEAIGSGQGTGSLTDRMTAAEEDIDALQDLVGDGTGSENTIMNRLGTAENDIDTIEDELATHDWKYAGSATENGAATKIVETETDADGYQDILVSSTDHTAAEYAAQSVAQVNPSTGALKVNSIVLGAATMVYDETSEALVINF